MRSNDIFIPRMVVAADATLLLLHLLLLAPPTDRLDILRIRGSYYYQILLPAIHSFSWKSYYCQPEGLLTQC